MCPKEYTVPITIDQVTTNTNVIYIPPSGDGWLEPFEDEHVLFETNPAPELYTVTVAKVLEHLHSLFKSEQLATRECVDDDSLF